MEKRDCRKCLWHEDCEKHGEYEVCGHFAFADAEEENEYFIEKTRRKFRREWKEYVEEE